MNEVKNTERHFAIRGNVKRYFRNANNLNDSAYKAYCSDRFDAEFAPINDQVKIEADLDGLEVKPEELWSFGSEPIATQTPAFLAGNFTKDGKVYAVYAGAKSGSSAQRKAENMKRSAKDVTKLVERENPLHAEDYEKALLRYKQVLELQRK